MVANAVSAALATLRWRAVRAAAGPRPRRRRRGASRRPNAVTLGVAVLLCMLTARPAGAQYLDVAVSAVRQIGRQCELGFVLSNQVDGRIAGIQARATIRDEAGRVLGRGDFVGLFQDGRLGGGGVMFPVECNRVARVNVRFTAVYLEGAWLVDSPLVSFSNRGARASYVGGIRMH